MNKLSKEKQTQLAIVIIVSVAALAAIWFFVIGTEQKALQQATARAAELKDKFERAEKLVNQKTNIEETRKRNIDELASIEEGMAPGDKYAWFIPLLTKFSDPYKNLSLVKVEKERVKPIEMLPKFPYQAASFRVMVTAFYVDFGRFLADFENTYPYFHIQGIDMSPTTSPTEDREKLDIRFDIVTLIKPTAE
jgi:hypothetical protein